MTKQKECDECSRPVDGNEPLCLVCHQEAFKQIEGY